MFDSFLLFVAFAFLLAGFVKGVLGLGLVWWLLVSPSPVRNGAAQAASKRQSFRTWVPILRKPETWAIVLGRSLTDPVWWFFLIWLPDYFKKTRGLDIKHSWVHLVSIYAVVTVLSIIGGWLTGYLTQRGYSVSRARKTAMFVSACLVVPIFAVTQVGDWSAVLLIGLAGAAA